MESAVAMMIDDSRVQNLRGTHPTARREASGDVHVSIDVHNFSKKLQKISNYSLLEGATFRR